MRHETVQALAAGIQAKHDEDMAELARIKQRTMWRRATYFELTGEQLISSLARELGRPVHPVAELGDGR